MKTIIAGSRTIHDYDLVSRVIADSDFTITEVFCGQAGGVDLLGCRWAREHNIPVKFFPADWKQYGKVAGFLRNHEMAAFAHQLILVWDGSSPGSAHMLKMARQCGLRVYAHSPHRVDHYDLSDELRTLLLKSASPADTHHA